MYLRHTLGTLSHAQAEIAEPLVIQSNCPILAEEFNHIWNDTLLVPTAKLVEVVLVETNETPKTLKNDFFSAHVSDRVDQTNGVEGELDKVTFTVLT